MKKSTPQLILKYINELPKSVFAEIGEPLKIQWNKDKSILGIVTHFPSSLSWSTKNIPHKDYLFLYEAKTFKLIASFVAAKYDINDFSFHPEEPIIAIATGNYDGGYYFEGELFIWHYLSDKFISILDENREIKSCKFSSSGHDLIFTISPFHEEFEDENQMFDSTYKTNQYKKEKINLNNLLKIRTSLYKKNTSRISLQKTKLLKNQLNALAESIKGNFLDRWGIANILWLTQKQLVLTRNKAIIELWDLEKHTCREFQISQKGEITQIFLNKTKEKIYINLCIRESTWKYSTIFYEFEIKSFNIIKKIEKEFAILLSQSKSGYFIGRDPNSLADNKSFVIDPNFNSIETLDLHDLHPELKTDLRIDNDTYFYLIHEDSRAPTSKRFLIQIDPITQKFEKKFSVEKYFKNSILDDGLGCYCEDYLGKGLILSFSFRNSSSTHSIVERKSLVKGENLWRKVFPSKITSMIFIPEREILVIAFFNKEIKIISSIDGRIIFNQKKLDRHILSLSHYHNQIAAGTLDGRILIYALKV